MNNYPKKNPKGSYSLPKNEFKYDGNIPPKEPVAYRDIDEFFAVNPNCCQITQRYKIVSQSAEINGSIDKISFWDQLNGTTTIVVVQYLLRYRDALGVVQSRLKETYSVMDDCGESRGVFYEREPLGIILISPIFDFLF